MEVIGVAGDATNGALDHGEVRPAVFIPYASSGISGGLLFARVSDDPATAIRSIRARLPDEVVYAHTLKSELDSWGWGSERMMTEVLDFMRVLPWCWRPRDSMVWCPLPNAAFPRTGHPDGSGRRARRGSATRAGIHGGHAWPWASRRLHH